jgi:predicted nucleic acid-binding protein
MRIMTDTNILVSAILFPNSIAKRILERIVVERFFPMFVKERVLF